MRVHSCKWLVLLGLAAGSIKLYQSRLELQDWVRLHQFNVPGLDKALPSEVYFLEPDRWLEFKIPRDTPLLRVISNASVSPSQPFDPANQWPYAIEYELRGPSQPVTHGTRLTAGVYHFKGEQLLFVDRTNAAPVELNSYLDRRMRPLSGREWVVNLQDQLLRHSEVLRLRLSSRHPDLLNVGVRVYCQTRLPQRKLTYSWNRLSEDQKRDLARGNVYGYEGLSDREKLFLVSTHWAVVAPEGVPGRDFQRRTLYVRDDSETLCEVKRWVPSGLLADPAHSAVLPITNGPGVCQIELTDYSGTSALQPLVWPQPLANGPGFALRVMTNTLIWHPALQPRIDTNVLTWTGPNHILALTNQGGLLEIRSSRPVYIRAFRVQPSLTNEVTPEPTHLLAFTVSPTNVLEYDIQHVQHTPTLFRIEVRRPNLTLAPALPVPAEAGETFGYAILDDADRIWRTGVIPLTNIFSAYDWLVTSNGLADATEPISLCFVLPPTISTFRLLAPTGQFLANAYSRPADLQKRIQVPEDYSPFKAMAPDQPCWFVIRPRDHIERREAGQAALFRVQPRIPEYDPLVLAGQYQWESFLPESEGRAGEGSFALSSALRADGRGLGDQRGSFRGHMVLLPTYDRPPSRSDDLSLIYSPVKTGCEDKVQLVGGPWESQVKPTLVLAFEQVNGGSAKVVLDGKTVLDGRLDGAVSELRLGEVTVGEHALKIQAEAPLSAYLNCLDPGRPQGPTLLNRFCVMGSSNLLTFPYVKRQSGPEVLVLRVFSPVVSNGPGPFDVRLALKGAPPRALGPFDELTFFERAARITPGSEPRSWVVAAAHSRLDEGWPVFFPVGADVPPGQYTLEIILGSDSPRWLSLSRTTPGVAETLALALQHRAF